MRNTQGFHRALRPACRVAEKRVLRRRMNAPERDQSLRKKELMNGQ